MRDDPAAIAPNTFSPGAASEMWEPVFEKLARLPAIVLAATASPTPPWPFEPGGWSAAAGYSMGLPEAYSLPAAATSRTSWLTAYSIARCSRGDAPTPPRLRLTILAPWSTA